MISIRKNIFAAGLCALALPFVFSSCGNAGDEPTDVKDTTKVDTMPKVEEPKQSVFYSVPSPIQLGNLLKKSGATFDKSMLNAVENADKYSTNTTKALNLGVYVADLSYATIFDQMQETMKYMDATKKLVDGLGTSGAFSAETIKRMEANKGKRDSLLQIISESYLNANESFREDAQANTFALALTGGFVEGLYLGTQAAKTSKKAADITTRIAELKGSLNNLLALLQTQNSDGSITSIIDELKGIKEVYDQSQENAQATVTADTTKGKITIGGKSSYTLSKEQLEAITAKAAALRANITKI